MWVSVFAFLYVSIIVQVKEHILCCNNGWFASSWMLNVMPNHTNQQQKGHTHTHKTNRGKSCLLFSHFWIANSTSTSSSSSSTENKPVPITNRSLRQNKRLHYYFCNRVHEDFLRDTQHTIRLTVRFGSVGWSVGRFARLSLSSISSYRIHRMCIEFVLDVKWRRRRRGKQEFRKQRKRQKRTFCTVRFGWFSDSVEWKKKQKHVS